MVKTITKFINATNTPIALKEGNAGVYTHICNLGVSAPHNQHSIEMDHNATYREYVVATGTQGQTLLVTSDDCAEYSTIKIVKSDDSTSYTFDNVKRLDPRGAEGFGILKWLRRPWNRNAQ